MYKSLFERLKFIFIFNFGKVPCSWIRIRILNKDPVQEIQINADPQYCCKPCAQMEIANSLFAESSKYRCKRVLTFLNF
jgi:hypothetical protein